jgi:hypothetical protein
LLHKPKTSYILKRREYYIVFVPQLIHSSSLAMPNEASPVQAKAQFLKEVLSV